MASHQDFVLRMVNSQPERFGEDFWRYVDAQVSPHLPSSRRFVDIGCSPGLLVRNLGAHFPGADLHGFDLTPAMIDYANSEVEFAGIRPNFGVLDITENPVPLEDHSVDLITMTAVLHVLDEPLETCAEILRLLAPNGVFLLSDWIRQPLSKYLEMMMTNVPHEQAEAMEKAMLRLSVAHNNYTIEDWLWLLDKGGLNVLDHTRVSAEHFCAFVCQVK